MSNPITQSSGIKLNRFWEGIFLFWVPVCAFLTLCSFILSPVWIEVLGFCELK